MYVDMVNVGTTESHPLKIFEAIRKIAVKRVVEILLVTNPVKLVQYPTREGAI